MDGKGRVSDNIYVERYSSLKYEDIYKIIWDGKRVKGRG